MKFWTINLLALTVTLFPVGATAQVENAAAVSKKLPGQSGKAKTSRACVPADETPKATVEFEHTVWREIDLNKGINGVLALPEDAGEGRNLFRLIADGVAQGTVTAYEFVDGREAFTPALKTDLSKVLARFGASDIESLTPTRYYVMETQSFDNLSHRRKRTVKALCPVVESWGDLGEGVRYPLFWVKFPELRPLLRNTLVAVSEIDGRPTHSLEDFFLLSLYDGEIYKTSNPRNLTLAELHPDSVSRAAARDSIEKRLGNYGAHLWLPTREEYLSANDSLSQGKQKAAKSGKALKPAKPKVAGGIGKRRKVSSSSASEGENPGAVKSVRRRRR